jgi:hypothetical protein
MHRKNCCFCFIVFLLVAGCSGVLSKEKSSFEISETGCDQVFEKCKNKMLSINLEKDPTKESLIAYSMLFPKHESSKAIESYVKKENNSILYFLYLSMQLCNNSDDKNILSLLTLYYEKDSDNAIPCYFLSYYYGLTQK